MRQSRSKFIHRLILSQNSFVQPNDTTCHNEWIIIINIIDLWMATLARYGFVHGVWEL